MFEARVAEDGFKDDEIDIMIYVINETGWELIKTLRKEKMISKKSYKKLKKNWKEVTE